MNKKQQNTVAAVSIIAVLLILVVVVFGPFYILNEGEQAVLVRFGQIVEVKQDAGIGIKVPFVDNVLIYTKKVFSWDGEAQLMPTSEKQFIWVDTTARLRIKDPKTFYAKLTTLENANTRITAVIESAVRTVVAENSLSAAVRNTNIINESKSQETIALSDIKVEQQPVLKASEGRRALSKKMLDSAKPILDLFGIEIIDLLIRQIRYSDQVTQNVYERMISERNQKAQEFRSIGEGQKKEWDGKTDSEQMAIMSEAYRQAETIKGEADAKAAKTYSDAYRKDPEFFAFWRAMESYRKTMDKFDMTLSTDMDYFRYLYSTSGR